MDGGRAERVASRGQDARGERPAEWHPVLPCGRAERHLSRTRGVFSRAAASATNPPLWRPAIEEKTAGEDAPRPAPRDAQPAAAAGPTSDELRAPTAPLALPRSAGPDSGPLPAPSACRETSPG